MHGSTHLRSKAHWVPHSLGQQRVVKMCVDELQKRRQIHQHAFHNIYGMCLSLFCMSHESHQARATNVRPGMFHTTAVVVVTEPKRSLQRSLQGPLIEPVKSLVSKLHLGCCGDSNHVDYLKLNSITKTAKPHRTWRETTTCFSSPTTTHLT